MALLPADPVKRGRLKLLALAGVFSLPVVLGWIAFVFDLVPGATGNYGELLAPRPVEGAALEALRGKWVLLVFDAPECDAYCERKLYFLRQVRRAQGREQLRVERAWVLTGSGAPRSEVLAAIEETRVLAPQGGRFLAQFPFNVSPADHVYLVDPRGNLMMRYPRDPDPSRMIRDLQRILRYARS
jgi:hypothetical protein